MASPTVASVAPTAAVSPQVQRLVLLVVMLAAALVAGFLTANPAATALAAQYDGAALVRLTRFMAAIKTLIAGAATIAILWRLAAPATAAWLGAYSLAAGAMAAGPILIWGLLHIGLGALLLHGGLAATLLLLWRDKAVGEELDKLLDRRR
jgi:hypothetical protein